LRRLLITLLLLQLLSLYAQTVAKIGDTEFFEEDLQSEIESLPPSDDYELLRKTALESLVEKALLLNYAKENFIFVNDTEVDNFFIANYGNHPKLQTNDVFDEQKYKQLKATPEMQTILKEISRELLLIKTEEIIKAQFNVSDDELLQMYILENAEIDISYAMIKDEQVNFPLSCTSEKAYKYYSDNKKHFLTDKKIRLTFFVVSENELAKNYELPEYEIIDLYESLKTEKTYAELRDSISNELLTDKLQKKAFNLASTAREDFRLGNEIDYPVMLSDYLSEEDNFGNFPNQNIIQNAFTMRLNEVSDPIDIGNGFLIYKVESIKEPEPILLTDIASKIWKEYVEYEMKSSYASVYKKFYETHLDSFIVPAAHISRVIIDPLSMKINMKVTKNEVSLYINEHEDEFSELTEIYSKDELETIVKQKIIKDRQVLRANNLIEHFKKNKAGKEALKRIAEDNSLEFSNRVIYLNKITNRDIYDSAIADDLKEKKNVTTAVINLNGKMLYYEVESYFPEYVPSFEEIESRFYDSTLKIEVNPDTVDYYQYYLKNKNNFFSSDSLVLGGIFVPISRDSINITDEQMKEYYQKNKDEFYRPESVILQAIFITDPNYKRENFINDIYFYAKKGVDFNILQMCFDEKGSLETEKPLILDELPKRISSVLEKNEKITEPVYHESGWYIFHIEKKITGRYLTYEQSKTEISERLKKEKSTDAAFSQAKKVFDSVYNFSQCAAYADSSWLFKTKLTSVNDEFDKIGNIQHLQKTFSKMRRAEKYNTLYHTDEGFAIIFMLEKKLAQQLQFEKAMSQITETHKKEMLQKTSRDFVNGLLIRIKEGSDPDSILFFFGGWKSLKKLSPDSVIPGVEESTLIMKDIVRRKQGDYSHVIRITENEYLFYHIDRMQKVSNKDFLNSKEEFRKNYLEKSFSNWFDYYKASQHIELYQ